MEEGEREESVEELQRQLRLAYNASSSYRLSERNTIELVAKLMEMNLIRLIFSSDGKEYLTLPQLEREVLAELAVTGRVAVLSLPQLLNVSLTHINQAVAQILADDSSITLVGTDDLINSFYLQNIVMEINDALQEFGWIELVDYAKKFNLPLSYLKQEIPPHLTSSSKFDPSEGVIYTTAFLLRTRARIRGKLSAITRPTALAAIEAKHAFPSSIFHKAVMDMIAKGEISGVVGGGGRRLFFPAVYLSARLQWLRSFYQGNGYLEYKTMNKLYIDDAPSFITKHFFAEEKADEKGVFLHDYFVSIAFVSQIDSLLSAALEDGLWADLRTLSSLPVTTADMALLLRHSPSYVGLHKGFDASTEKDISIDDDGMIILSAKLIQKVKSLLHTHVKANPIHLAKLTASSTPVSASASATASATSSASAAAVAPTGGESEEYTIVVSPSTTSASLSASTSSSAQPSTKGNSAKSKPAGTTGHDDDDADDDDWGKSSGKKASNKKKTQKSKNNAASSGQSSQTASAATTSSSKNAGSKNEIEDLLRLSGAIELIIQSECQQTKLSVDDEVIVSILSALCKIFTPMVAALREEERKALFTASSTVSSTDSTGDRPASASTSTGKSKSENPQEKFSVMYDALLLFRKALVVLSEAHPSLPATATISSIIEKHLIKTICTDITNHMIVTKTAHLSSLPVAASSLTLKSEADRTAAINSFPKSQQAAFQALSSSLSKKTATIDAFVALLPAAANGCEFIFRQQQLTKKDEKALIQAQRQQLLTDMAVTSGAEFDPSRHLLVVVTLLFLCVYGVVLSIPGRVVADLITLLHDGSASAPLVVPPEILEELKRYHQNVMKLLTTTTTTTNNTDNLISETESGSVGDKADFSYVDALVEHVKVFVAQHKNTQ